MDSINNRAITLSLAHLQILTSERHYRLPCCTEDAIAINIWTYMWQVIAVDSLWVSYF